jgi:hypothetical protein
MIFNRPDGRKFSHDINELQTQIPTVHYNTDYSLQKALRTSHEAVNRFSR